MSKRTINGGSITWSASYSGKGLKSSWDQQPIDEIVALQIERASLESGEPVAGWLLKLAVAEIEKRKTSPKPITLGEAVK